MYIRTIIALLCLSVALPCLAKTRLNFALLAINGPQRDAYHEQVKAFEQAYPDIEVNIQAVESEQYKQNIEKWLAADEFSDVMFWFGGERLNWYVKKGWVLPIDDLWGTFAWYQRITQSAQTSVTRNGRIYGLPIHYYHWGIYYNKQIFRNLGLQEPKTWEEFLAVCKVLRTHEVTPIALGSSEAWPLAGWFDYLNLRLNGIEFHQGLTEGRESYGDPKVLQVFATWQELIDQQYFLQGHETLTWREALPYLYRDMAAMYLMGNFWTTQIPETMRHKFGMFAFPSLNEEMPRYEEAPTDVLFIPSNVKNLEAAKLFMEFMSRTEVQHKLNERLGMLSPQNIPPQKMDEFLQKGNEILEHAQGATQFYDRDNPKPIATEGMKLMQRFVAEPAALPSLIDEYEKLRFESFK